MCKKVPVSDFSFYICNPNSSCSTKTHASMDYHNGIILHFIVYNKLFNATFMFTSVLHPCGLIFDVQLYTPRRINPAYYIARSRTRGCSIEGTCPHTCTSRKHTRSIYFYSQSNTLIEQSPHTLLRILHGCQA